MKKITSLIFVLAVLILEINAQIIITVDNSIGANAQYSDLQTAIDNATSGDIIYIHPSEISYGNVTMDKSLTLIGFGHSNPLRNTFIEGIVIGDNTSNSRFTGLHITDEILIQNSNTAISGLVFENSIIDFLELGDFFFYQPVNDVLVRGCISITISGDATNTLITNSIIKSRIIVGDNFNSVTVRNNLFFRASSGGQKPMTNSSSSLGSIAVQNSIFYDDRGNTTDNNVPGVIYENCLSYNQGAGDVVLMDGTNNLDNINPLFVNVTDDVFDADFDYSLQAGSPAIGAGALGVDIGLFDNAGFTYNNFGFTQGIPTVTITAITDQVAPDQMVEVTIESSSN